MADHKVKLFMHPGTCATISHILLTHVGIPFEIEPVTTDKMTGDFAKLNPKKQVPVLVFNDNVVTEGPAIINAINHLAPEKKITGKDAIQFIRLSEWLNWLSGSLHASFWGAFARPWRFTNDPAGEAAVREQCKAKVIERFDMIEAKLPEDGWILGDNFTAVDAYIFPFFRWGQGKPQVNMAARYPKWAKHTARMWELEAVKTVMEKEGKIQEALDGKSDYHKLR